MAFGPDVTPPDLGGTTIGLLFTFNQVFSRLGPLAAVRFLVSTKAHAPEPAVRPPFPDGRNLG